MVIVKDRFWLVVKLNRDIIKANLSFRDQEHSSNGKLENIDLDDQQNYTHLKKRMLGHPAVGVDKNPERLVLVTDVYGMLPVFSYCNDNTYYFFSHFPDLINELPNLQLTPDSAGIWEAMTFDVILGRRTIFREIKMLPSSSVITIDLRTGMQSEVKYDNLTFEAISGIDERKAGKKAVELLKKALAKIKGDHFLLPLSGGVDSRLLAAVMVEVFGPDRITALSFACRPSSYEFVYAKKTCDILGIKDWRGHILTADSYLRSLQIFPHRFGGNLSISHGHLYDALQANKDKWAGMTLVSGAFADAAGGYGAKSPELCFQSVEESDYYRHLIKIDSVLHLGQTRACIEQDIKDIYNDWQNGSKAETFDEYAYVTQRQPRVLFPQSILYSDILPVGQPFTYPELSEFLFGLPFELRDYKRAIRAAIRHINPRLYKLPDISSKMMQDSWTDRLHIYSGKVLNNLNLLFTYIFNDRRLFFSPYQTECQDYNLRTSHRRLALEAIEVLQECGVISKEQGLILKKKTYRQYKGIHLACAQYWAITVAAALNQFSNKKANLACWN